MGRYKAETPGELGPLKDSLTRLARQQREDGRPSGTEVADALATLTDLVNGLLDATTLSATGNITTTAGYFVSPVGPTFDITTGRVAAWWRTSDGRLAFASSSRRKKTNIVPAAIDPMAVLQLEDVHYNYIAEVRKRDDPEYEGYVGPDYHVATEVGLIAEQLHDLGLWQFVQYEREPDPERPSSERLRLDENGEPIPAGIHYSMLAVALLPVLRLHQRELARLQDEVAELRALVQN